MGFVISICYLCLFLGVGIVAARQVFPAEGMLLHLPLGCAAGISLLAALPALFALLWGFTLPAMAAAGWPPCCWLFPAAISSAWGVR